jgi:CBS domain containing-hemolysin-like protein
MTDTLRIVLLSAGLLLCLYLSAFFSSSEMGYSAANTIRLENRKDEGDKRAKRALKIIERFDDTLGAILIGNNLVNIAASSIAAVLFIVVAGSDQNSWIATVLLTCAVIIFGETIPKITAKKRATSVALRNAYAIRGLGLLLYPFVKFFVWLVNLITAPMKGEEEDPEEAAEEAQAELTNIIETAEEEGVLDEDESELITAAIDFQDISAFEVMTARVDMEALDIDEPWEEILRKVDETDYSRLPVYEETVDHIIGVLHLNIFLKAIADHPETPVDIRSMLMPPTFVYKTAKLPAVMQEFKRARQHLAIVADEYGGTLGVISMEDCLEEIVGEIWDETDEIEQEVVELKTGEVEIDGDVPIGEFIEMMGIPEADFEADSDTVGGWCCEMLEKFPEPGEEFFYECEEPLAGEEPFLLQVNVLAMDGLRVERVRVNKVPTGEE